jgi:hypothetical protein
MLIQKNQRKKLAPSILYKVLLKLVSSIDIGIFLMEIIKQSIWILNLRRSQTNNYKQIWNLNLTLSQINSSHTNARGGGLLSSV